MTRPVFGVNTMCRHCHGTGKHPLPPLLCGFCQGVGFTTPPPSTDNEFSQAAASSMEDHAAKQRAAVLAAIKAHGPVSDQDLARITGFVGDSIRPRRGELEAAGLIVKAGRGVTESGRSCQLWAAAEVKAA